MSDQGYVVMPVRADGAQQQNPDEFASAIQKSLHEKLHPGEHQATKPEDGPLKKVMANQDSLYKYISWEDPFRTLGSYLGLLSLLLGVHYLHPTQLFLKIGATGLGAVSFLSLVSRATKSDFFARLRPEYKQVPESTLNATLKDIHDLVQYSVVQAQKVVWGEDIEKTFGAFFGVTALFWLIKVVSPFGLAILGLTSLYIAPLVSSPRGRQVAQDAKVRAQELANATAENAKGIAQDGKAKAAELSSKAQQTAGNLSASAQQTAADTKQRVGFAAQNGQQTAADTYNQAKGTAAELSNQARETAPRVAGTATEHARQLPNLGANALNSASDTVGSSLGIGSQKYGNDSRFSNTDGGHHDSSNRYATVGQPVTKVEPKVTVDGTIPRYDQTRT
ncbi:hypothetical protein SLS62_009919 [Diatrype stigma]|uniref:Reticulon domain-containing protein n=1 Tax=Diatrype stigma TaxID=117547 RepID=A0AAN9UEY9_9PEZI